MPRAPPLSLSLRRPVMLFYVFISSHGYQLETRPSNSSLLSFLSAALRVCRGRCLPPFFKAQTPASSPGGGGVGVEGGGIKPRGSGRRQGKLFMAFTLVR